MGYVRDRETRLAPNGDLCPERKMTYDPANMLTPFDERLYWSAVEVKKTKDLDEHSPYPEINWEDACKIPRR